MKKTERKVLPVLVALELLQIILVVVVEVLPQKHPVRNNKHNLIHYTISGLRSFFSVADSNLVKANMPTLCIEEQSTKL